jgi:hypothetical protein
MCVTLEAKMQVQSVSFAGHQKHHHHKSVVENLVEVAGASAVGAGGGYLVGKYAVPVKQEAVDSIITNKAFESAYVSGIDTYMKGIEDLDKEADELNKQLAENRVPKEIEELKLKLKVNEEKTKNYDLSFIEDAYHKIFNSSPEELQKRGEIHYNKVYESMGGKEKAIKTIKNELSSETAKRFGIIGAIGFAGAIILDKLFVANRDD